MTDTIYIIGSGAIGKALAVSLVLAGRKVVLLRGSVDDGSSQTEEIEMVLADQEKLVARVSVSTVSNFAALDGIIVFANKSYGNERLAASLAKKTGRSPLVILQNGLGVEEAFIDHHYPEVYRCVLFATSLVVSTNQVRFKPVAVSPIGPIQGNAVRLGTIVGQLDSPHFRFRAEANIQPVIWKKAIANCVFNSICPLLDTDNGIFHRDASALEMANEVIAECLLIAREQGILLKAGEITESLLSISRFSDGQLISTLQDIRQKRETEIDTLNFAIVRMARTLNKEELVQKTRLLGELTRLKAALNR